MSDKPTYKEFRGMLSGVVKTADGRYYVADNDDALRRIFLAANIVLEIVLLLIYYFVLADIMPANAIFEFCLLSGLIFLLINWLQYRLTRFRELANDTEEFRDIDRRYSDRWAKGTRIFRGALSILVLTFALANSFTAQFIRSVIEDRPEFVSVTAYYGCDLTITPEGEDTYQVTISQDEMPALIVTIAGTPKRALAFFDGQPMTKGFRRSNLGNWFWEEKYFKAIYYIFLEETDICDGSVLELTCGDLYRSWVFRLVEA